jgi:predicted transcriptional regulator
VPLASVVLRVEAIYQHLVSPRRAIPAFARRVAVISADDALSEALRLAADQSYSQLPVYRRGRFLGLLTENGITRWLAEHAVARAETPLDLARVPVSDVLDTEERRHNVDFVSRDESVDQLLHLFVRHPTLEAVLITEHGDPAEALLGIATRWDIVDEVLG